MYLLASLQLPLTTITILQPTCRYKATYEAAANCNFLSSRQICYKRGGISSCKGTLGLLVVHTCVHWNYFDCFSLLEHIPLLHFSVYLAPHLHLSHFSLSPVHFLVLDATLIQKQYCSCAFLVPNDSFLPSRYTGVRKGLLVSLALAL